jgi:hypothetical protein
VEPEDLAQDREVVGFGPVEVEPEEAAAREQLGDRLPAEVDRAARAVLADDADRRPAASRRRPRQVTLLGLERLERRRIGRRGYVSRLRRVRRRNTTVVTMPMSQPRTTLARMIQTSEAWLVPTTQPSFTWRVFASTSATTTTRSATSVNAAA